MLSGDYLAVAVGWDLSLADIKELCRASIVHSFLSQEEKDAMLSHWEKSFDEYVKAF